MFLEGLSYASVWTANRYISGDASDGGKTRILMLTLHSNDSLVASTFATTNEEKSAMLMKLMFPSKPNGCQVPSEEYADQLPPPTEITEGQVWRHVVKLSPHKAPGANGIPNIILKMNVDIILPYLL